MRLNLKLSEHVLEADDGPLNGSTTSMVDLGPYIFKDLNTGEITPEGLFTNDYTKEIYGSEHVHTATKKPHVILYNLLQNNVEALVTTYVQIITTSVQIIS